MTRYRKIILIFGFLIVVFGALCVGYGYFIEPDQLLVNRYEIKIEKWNPAFDDFKIVAVSDIHGGSNAVTEAKLRQIVELINAQDADIVVFLGDYVSQQPFDRSKLKMPMATIAANLSGIKSKYGVFMVFGNHDGWYNETDVRRHFERIGYTVLENELAFVEKNGQKLRVLGLKDHTKIKTWQGFSADAREVLESNDEAGDVIVLEHSPDILPIITGEFSISDDLKLMLAGHTHGGQIRFPFIGSPIVPSSFGQKYAAGHVKDKGLDMFVTTGIGTSILPFRFLVPPEIAVINVRTAN